MPLNKNFFFGISKIFFHFFFFFLLENYDFSQQILKKNNHFSCVFKLLNFHYHLWQKLKKASVFSFFLSSILSIYLI